MYMMYDWWDAKRCIQQTNRRWFDRRAAINKILDKVKWYNESFNYIATETTIGSSDSYNQIIWCSFNFGPTSQTMTQPLKPIIKQEWGCFSSLDRYMTIYLCLWRSLHIKCLSVYYGRPTTKYNKRDQKLYEPKYKCVLMNTNKDYCPAYLSKHQPLVQFWFNVGLASKTVG